MAENEKTEVVAAEKAAKDVKSKDAKPRKPGFWSKIKKFFKDNKSELKKVVWYGKKQTIKSTGLVIASLVIVSAVVSLLDLGLSRLIMWIGSLI